MTRLVEVAHDAAQAGAGHDRLTGLGDGGGFGGRMVVPSASNPNGRHPPCQRPCSAAWRRAARTRSPLCSLSNRAHAHNVRATARPEGVARSSGPAFTECVTTPRRSARSI